jgi:hypothetical protein
MILPQFERSFGIGTRLGTSFGALILYSLLLAGFSAYQQRRLHDALYEHDRQAQPAAQIVYMLLGIDAMRRDQMQLVQATSEAEMTRLQNSLLQDRSSIEAGLEKYRVLSADRSSSFQKVESRVHAYTRVNDQIVALATTGQRDAAIKLLRRGGYGDRAVAQ